MYSDRLQLSTQCQIKIHSSSRQVSKHFFQSMYKKIGFYKCSDCFDESGSFEWQFWSTSFIVKSNSPHMSNTHHLFKSSSIRIKWYESLSCAIGTSGEYDTFEWNKGQYITWLHLIRQLGKCTEVVLSSGATRLSCTTGEIASHWRRLEFVSKVVERGPCQVVRFVRVVQLVKLAREQELRTHTLRIFFVL